MNIIIATQLVGSFKITVFGSGKYTSLLAEFCMVMHRQAQ